jgi:hypothetical protein
MKRNSAKACATRACTALGRGLALLWVSSPAFAQQAAGSLGLPADPIALPGLGRVVLAFILVAALAVAAVLVLQRFGPRFGAGSLFAGGGSLRVLERLQLARDLHVHLVQTECGKVLITAHRQSIAVVLLDAASPGGGQS